MAKPATPRPSRRKGAAIEMAMLVMVVTFSFSVLITTTSLLHHDKKVKAEKDLARTVAMEQIAYDFCAAYNGGDAFWMFQYADYDIAVEDLTLTVKEKDAETVLLYVTLQQDGETYRISSWEMN